MTEITPSSKRNSKGHSRSSSLSSGETQKLTLLPVQLVTPYLSDKILEYIPDAIGSKKFQLSEPSPTPKENSEEIEEPSSVNTNDSLCTSSKGLVSTLLSSILHFDTSHIEDDTLNLLLGLLNKVLPNSKPEPVESPKLDEAASNSDEDNQKDDEEFEIAIDDEDNLKESEGEIILEENDHKELDHSLPIELLNKILPNLIQTVLEESRSLKPEESQQLKSETCAFVNKLLKAEEEHISKPEIEEVKSQKETLVLVNDLLEKTSPLSVDEHKTEDDIDQIKKDTLALVGDLLTKVDRITKTIHTKSSKDPEKELTEQEQESQHFLPVIDDIKEVSTESSPVDSQKDFVKENKDQEADSQPVQEQIDQSIPVIDINNVKSQKTPQLNRTNSVELPTIKKLGKEFGSHETLPVTFRKSPFVFTKTGKLAAINRSFIKSSNISNNPSRSGSISESSGVSTPKKSVGITKRVSHRSEIVAAVTQRLYSKRKQKEGEKMQEGPKFNARIRLQDITQRALRASKRRSHVETQTEEPCTVRMKEKATDVQDIALANLEVRDAEINAVAQMHAVGVNCQIQTSNSSIKLTGTSSTQTEEHKQNQVSFKKYLQDPPLRILPYSQPIYTSSVNINVRHNYSHKDELSDDSLDENCVQTVQFSTPDLISNHNSLEQVNVQAKPQVCVTTQTEKKSILHADINKENFVLNECFATKKAEYCMADTSFVLPLAKQTLTDISIPVARASSVCCLNEFSECCKPLRVKYQKPDPIRPIISFERCHNVKSTKTPIHQSPFRTPSPLFEEQYSTGDESEEECCSSTHKKVRFAPSKHKDILDVVTNFLDEASNLLFKLNHVANKVDQSKVTRSTYQQQIPRMKKECYVQTLASNHDASSQTPQKDDIFQNWSQPTISCSTQTKSIQNEDSDSDYMNMQTTSTDWKYCPTQEYSSLDTIRSTSDYGSMSRPKTSRKNHYSPKAYMKQLIEMRKKIIEDSRNDILGNEFLRLPSPEIF